MATSTSGTRVRIELTPEQRERLRQLRAQVEHEAPEIKSRARATRKALQEAASSETTISGPLRRAIQASGRSAKELAEQLGVTPRLVAEFLAGKSSLDSCAIDKLGSLLKQELRPITSPQGTC